MVGSKVRKVKDIQVPPFPKGGLGGINEMSRGIGLAMTKFAMAKRDEERYG
jgi:hypothetical protein